MTADRMPNHYLDEPREIRLDFWQRQADACRRSGRADLVAICQDEIDAIGAESDPATWRWTS